MRPINIITSSREYLGIDTLFRCKKMRVHSRNYGDANYRDTSDACARVDCVKESFVFNEDRNGSNRSGGARLSEAQSQREISERLHSGREIYLFRGLRVMTGWTTGRPQNDRDQNREYFQRSFIFEKASGLCSRTKAASTRAASGLICKMFALISITVTKRCANKNIIVRNSFSYEIFSPTRWYIP